MTRRRTIGSTGAVRAAMAAALAATLLSGCGGGSDPDAAAPVPSSGPGPPVSAPTTSAVTDPAPSPPPPTSGPTTSAPAPPTSAGLPAAPWAAAKLGAGQVPDVVVSEWRAAGSRPDCGALAPADLGPAAAGTARRADFGSGAWGVAWDVPGAAGRQADGRPCDSCGRGTVVVAGTGVDVPPTGPLPGASTLPLQRRWADGSIARYGLEGGSGPAYLAQLQVSGQRCLYNVVSFLGQGHLERLLGSLRFVAGAP